MEEKEHFATSCFSCLAILECSGSINHRKHHEQSKELASRRAYMSALMHHAVSNRVQLNRSWRAPARQQDLN